MLCYGLLGISFVIFSAYDLRAVIQFFAGRRRDLYFAGSSGRKWQEQAQHGISFLIMGAGTFLTGIFNERFEGMFLVVSLMLLVCWIPASFVLLRFLRPRWISAFEAGRSREDIQQIQERGAYFLERFPDIFPRMINSGDGWDMWVITVI